MKVPDINKNESVLEYANRLSEQYNIHAIKDAKKNKGQFFTPLPIARYMASLINFNSNMIRILDPGAGMGILSIALIEQIIKSNPKMKDIHLVLYETDKEILPLLKKVLIEMKNYLLSIRINFIYEIIEEDFIKANSDVLDSDPALFGSQKNELFNVIISNPPYFKVRRDSVKSARFNDIVSGQPNIYFLFMALSAKLLNDNGQMIFITPRSFCSGLYYNKFRIWLIKQVHISNIHLFVSRKDVFNSEGVLQENVIIRFTKRENDGILVSQTENGDFSDVHSIQVQNSDVIYKRNGFTFFRIPSDKNELNVVRELDKLPLYFHKLGIKISTGKVVVFRNKDYLRNEPCKNCVPFLWMHNIKNMEIKWPLSKKNKAQYMVNDDRTRKLLISKGNYVLLKRFTTKEQKRRFEIGLLFEESFKGYPYVALDNKVNYIYDPKGRTTRNQVLGIAHYLNLPSVDLYFRVLNGHTQVNANEVYALPFPSMDELEKIGKLFNIGKHTIKNEKKILDNPKINTEVFMQAGMNG